jgi:hypothetical protein
MRAERTDDNGSENAEYIVEGGPPNLRARLTAFVLIKDCNRQGIPAM